MTQYEVTTIMGIFYVVADKYSVHQDGTRVMFWVGRKIKQSFLIDELVDGLNGIKVVNPNV